MLPYVWRFTLGHITLCLDSLKEKLLFVFSNLKCFLRLVKNKEKNISLGAALIIPSFIKERETSVISWFYCSPVFPKVFKPIQKCLFETIFYNKVANVIFRLLARAPGALWASKLKTKWLTSEDFVFSLHTPHSF